MTRDQFLVFVGGKTIVDVIHFERSSGGAPPEADEIVALELVLNDGSHLILDYYGAEGASVMKVASACALRAGGLL